MSNKNPYVKLERMSYSVIESFLTFPHSRKEQSEKENEKPPKFAKPEVKTGRLSRLAKSKEKNEKPPKFSQPKVKNATGSKFAKPDKTGRLSRLAKQKVKRYKDVSNAESSDPETDDSEGKHNNFQGSDDEVKPDFKMPRPHRPQHHGRFQKQVKELTEYEKMVLKNKNDKMAFLESLKINEVKESFSEAVKGFSLAVRQKRIYKKQPPTAPRVKIARSSKVEINLSEKAVHNRAHSEAEEALKKIKEMEENKKEKQKEKRILPESLHLQDALHSDQSYEIFVNDFKHLGQECTEPIDNYAFRFNDMELLTSHVKTFPTVLTALDIHPMQEKTIIAGGGQNGNIYLWNMTDPEPYAFELHNQGFSLLKFNPEHPHLIMCCSKDGSMRKGDLVSNVYNKVTDSEDCTYFDFLSPETCLVSHRDGYVTVVDMRDSKRKSKQIFHQCHDKMLRSVSVHPLNKNEFITPTAEGCVRLWDLRKLQEHPIVEVCHSNKREALYSSIYSPLTGKSVLTSSKGGEICRSDTAKWFVLPLKKFKRRLPVSFSIPATWQPRSDSVFAMTSCLNLRSIDIYNRCKNIYSHECNKGTIHFCTFHPSLPIIAAVGYNKVFPFADKKL